MSRGGLVLLEIFIAVTGVLVAAIVGHVQTREASKQAHLALEQNAKLSQNQLAFDKYLNELEQWRKNPNLVVLRSWQTTTEIVTAVVQNEGGRDLVLFDVSFEPMTTATEPKYGASLGPGSSRGTVDTADRSKVLPLDLSMKDFTGQPSFKIDPPAIIEPGKSLVIKIKLNPRTISGFLSVSWNSPKGILGTNIGII